MDVEVSQEPIASVNEHGVVIVTSGKISNDSKPLLDTNNDVSPLHVVTGSELDTLKTEEIITGIMDTDSGITVENNNDIESGLDLNVVHGVVKTEQVNVSVSAPDPKPEVCLPILDAEMAVYAPQPDLLVESTCLPVEEKSEDHAPFGEVTSVPVENGDLAPVTAFMTSPDSASQPEKIEVNVLPEDYVIPVCFPSDEGQVERVTVPPHIEKEDPQELWSENLDSAPLLPDSLPPLPDLLPPLASCLPVENGDLLPIAPDMLDPGVEVIPRDEPPPEPYSPPEKVELAVVASPDITEDKSEVFLPGVSDSWLDGNKSNDSIPTRGESRVKFSDSFDISTSAENTDKKQEAVSVSEANENHVGVMTPEEEYRLRRSTSMESRDNPFIPDGELSKETDELLKRATVIRDTFILDEEARQRADSQNLPNDSNVMSVAVEQPVVVQETVVVSASAKPAQATPDKKAKKNKKEKKLKENGKVEDSVSPDANKPSVTGRGDADKPSAASDKTDSAPDDVDNKKQKKCCAIM